MANLQMCIKGGSRGKCPGWLIRFEYDPDLVEKLKRIIPHTHREWRDDSKTWWISSDYEDELDRLFSNWYALAKLQGSLF